MWVACFLGSMLCYTGLLFQFTKSDGYTAQDVIEEILPAWQYASVLIMDAARL